MECWGEDRHQEIAKATLPIMSSIQIQSPSRAGTLWHAAVGLERPCHPDFKPKEEIAKVVLRKEEDKFRAERTLLQV